MTEQDRKREALNPEAIFSDGTEMFRSPCEPELYDTVTLRLRVGKNQTIAASVVLENADCLEMERYDSDNYFDWYRVCMELADERVCYTYEIEADDGFWYFDRTGLHRTREEADKPFMVMPGFHTPDWAKGAVMYQIFVDRFCNGDPTNDVQTGEYFYIDRYSKEVNEWSRNPEPCDVQEFYGGDLAGIIRKMDYLQDLGVEVLYLNPIFVSPSSHKYDSQDYDYIDPHFGCIIDDSSEGLSEGDRVNAHSKQYVTRVTSLKNLKAGNDLFAMLTEEAHKRGMRVIIDGVFNHCGSFNKWLDREEIYRGAEGFENGAFYSKDSPYRSFFDFHTNEETGEETYDGWWGHETLPKLCYEQSPKLKSYIMRIARKWVSEPYNADGWRLDVAADLGHSEEYNHGFWKDFRRNVKSTKPDALILAEHYGDAGEWLHGDEWDSVMNYDAFMEPVSWFLTGMEKHSDYARDDMLDNDQAFTDAMKHYMARFQMPSLLVAMNELSNHDHSRFLTRTNRRVGRIESVGADAANEGVMIPVMREAVMIQMTWPGAPTIYYGDEAGVCGWTDPDNRRTYPWGRENRELIEYHREIIRIHRSYESLRKGSLVMLCTEHGLLAYARMTEKEAVVTVINNNMYEKTVDVPVWKAGIPDNRLMVRLIQTDAYGFTVESQLYATENGHVRVSVPPNGGLIFKNMR